MVFLFREASTKQGVRQQIWLRLCCQNRESDTESRTKNEIANQKRQPKTKTPTDNGWRKCLILMVAWGRIELPTQGFSIPLVENHHKLI